MPVPVPVFCYLFFSEKLFWEVSRNVLKIYGIYFQAKQRRSQKDARGVGHSLQTPSKRGPTLGRAWAPPGRLGRLPELPFRL